jgi:hypothetical protein
MNKSIPNTLAYTQLIAFVVIYAVWILPETTALRNIALILGAVASLYPLYLYRDLCLSRYSVAIWLIISLFLLVFLHYSFIGENQIKQLKELNSIWKYAIILGIFAVGLGITIAKTDQVNLRILFYIGITAPIIIFLLKAFINNVLGYANIEVPKYITIPRKSSEFYIQKMDYVLNCLPSILFSLVGIYLILLKKSLKKLSLLVYVLIFFSGVYVFYEINSKNGIMIVTIFLLSLTFFSIKLSKKNIFYVVLIMVLSVPLLLNHYNKNEIWKNLVEDIKVAKNTSEILEWKNPNSEIIILNSNNQNVSKTVYFRIAWFIKGITLILEYPFGYGLVENSFRYLALKKWEDASPLLSNTHSGWLDFTLAFGMVGSILIIFSIFFLIIRSYIFINNLKNSTLPIYVFTGSVTLLIIGLTNEISAKSAIPMIIFWIMLGNGLLIGMKDNIHTHQVTVKD